MMLRAMSMCRRVYEPSSIWRLTYMINVHCMSASIFAHKRVSCLKMQNQAFPLMKAVTVSLHAFTID